MIKAMPCVPGIRLPVPALHDLILRVLSLKMSTEPKSRPESGVEDCYFSSHCRQSCTRTCVFQTLSQTVTKLTGSH